MNRRHRHLVIAIPLLAGGLLLGGCSGSSSGTKESTKATVTTTPAATGVEVTSLDVVPSVECNGKTSVDISIGYAVEGAARQELYVDGRKVDGTEQASGTVTTWVHCDTLPHTIDIVGYDARDRHTTLEKKVTTNL